MRWYHKLRYILPVITLLTTVAGTGAYHLGAGNIIKQDHADAIQYTAERVGQATEIVATTLGIQSSTKSLPSMTDDLTLEAQVKIFESCLDGYSMVDCSQYYGKGSTWYRTTLATTQLE